MRPTLSVARLGTGSSVALTKSSTVPSCRKQFIWLRGTPRACQLNSLLMSKIPVSPTYGLPRNIFIMTRLNNTGLILLFQMRSCSAVLDAWHTCCTSFDTPARKNAT